MTADALNFGATIGAQALQAVALNARRRRVSKGDMAFRGETLPPPRYRYIGSISIW
jgi:hypothetical protein